MLQFKTIIEEKECEDLWEDFSKKRILWDLWDFRFCFHNKNFEFNFILGFDGNGKEGIIPLVYDKDYSTYTYFGDTFPEQNKFFLKDKKKLNIFLENCPNDTQIYYIDSEEAKYYDFKVSDKRFFLGWEKYGHSFENYLRSFNKKHRKNLNYDLRKLVNEGYVMERNKIRDFEKLVDLNKKIFGKNSDYSEEYFINDMKQLINTANEKNILDLLSIQINNKTEAVGLGVYYNKIYYVLGTGRNPRIKNLGKLLITEQIKSAISHNCSKVDFMSTEANWKELWNLDSEQMYEFEN